MVGRGLAPAATKTATHNRGWLFLGRDDRILNLGFALRCAGCGGAVGGVEIQEMCIAKTSIRGYNDFGKVFSRDAFKKGDALLNEKIDNISDCFYCLCYHYMYCGRQDFK